MGRRDVNEREGNLILPAGLRKLLTSSRSGQSKTYHSDTLLGLAAPHPVDAKALLFNENRGSKNRGREMLVEMAV